MMISSSEDECLFVLHVERTAEKYIEASRSCRIGISGLPVMAVDLKT
jgi:hypothetical protein